MRKGYPMSMKKIRKFLDEAKKTALLPDDQIETITLELEIGIIEKIRELAEQWNCTENDIVVAIIMAMCSETENE